LFENVSSSNINPNEQKHEIAFKSKLFIGTFSQGVI